MKKIITSILVPSLMCLSAIFADDPQVLGLSDLTQQLIENFTQGNMTGTILECKEGEVLPFHLNLVSEYLELSPEEDCRQTIRILKTIYIKCDNEKEQFLFSADLLDWKEFLEFFTGQIGVSLNVQEAPQNFGLYLELHQR